MEVMIEVSARHVHLTQEAVEILFGAGAQLTPRKQLTTPGLFAAEQKVDVVGPRNTLRGVTILAPSRKYNQVELAKTDARTLGIEAPVRLSGDLNGTPGCRLVGPAGVIDLEEGVIVAKRHIHLPKDMAESMDLKMNDVVGVEVEGTDRAMTMKDVVVRIGRAGPFIHIDTDEANAAGISGRAQGTLSRL